jgi:hypothetical protein
MKEYKGIIDKLIKDSYEESLVIDVFNDKIYKYAYVNDDIVKLEELSYADYLNKCNSFIYGDDLDKYIESLSIGNDTNVVRYKMLDESGNYQEYVNNIIKYKDDGNDLIVVLVAKDKDLDNIVSNNTNSISNMENKLKRMVDSIGNAILKIHNVINNGGSVNNKKECIEAILAGIVNEYPEFNEVINSNMNNLFLQKKSTIMIIDDDKMTCSLIKKIFDKDYDIIIANNGKEAIEYLSDNDNSSFKANIACIFLDLLMPVLDGFSVLDYLNDNNYLNKLPVIIISGNYDKETRNRAYSYQIADMLEKPFNVQVVRHRIEKMINLYKSSSSVNNMMVEQHRELKNIANSLIVSYEIDNEKMMKMVKKYTRILAIQVSVDYKEYNINNKIIDKIAESAGYYGIGNYTLPKSVLYKRGMYSEEERSLIKMANINGANIIKYVLARDNNKIDEKYCYEIVKYYNERYDGNGYPEGLSGNSIPLSTQIASVAIEYSNLINTITPVDYDRVASLIIMESGRKFNPKIVESFKKVMKEFEGITKVGE